MSNYYLILTQHGSNRLAQAQANTRPFVISHLALGDANGLPYLPQSRANATALVNERVRVDVQSVAVVGTQTEVVVTIESTIGGFNLHEIALLDEDGLALYLGNFTGAYKPILTEGAGGDMEFVLTLATDGLTPVVIEMNPTVVIANRQWVIDGFVRIPTFDAHVTQNSLEHANLLLLIQQLTQTLADTQEELMDTQVIQGIQQTLMLMQERLNALEQQRLEDVAVGDVWITTNSFADSAAVAAHKGYTSTWQLISQGCALVGLSMDANAPQWTQSIGSTHGEYEHQLTVDELAIHSHAQLMEYGGDNPFVSSGDTGTDLCGETVDSAQYVTPEGHPLHTAESGENQPHNNIQPSYVVAIWQRLT